MSEASPAPLVDRALGLLGDGPLAVDVLADQLGLAPGSPEESELGALTFDPRVVILPDGRAVGGVALGRGRTGLHRLTAEEVARRVVRLDEDVAGQVATALDPSGVRVGEHEVELRAEQDADGEDDLSADPLVDLPSGWHDDLGEGDVVGLTVDDEGRLVLSADGLDVAPGGEDGGMGEVRAAICELGAAIGTPLVGDGDPWVLDLIGAIMHLYAERSSASEGLRRPLTDVFDQAGMAYGGGYVGSPGLEDHRLRLFQIGADVLGGPWADPDVLDQAEGLGTVWMLLLGAGDAEMPEPARAVVVAASLDDPEAPIALARHVRSSGIDVGAGHLDRLVAAAAVDPSAPGPAHLLAEVSLLTGAEQREVDGLAAALVDADDDEWADAIELLAHLRAVGGDLDGACRALARIGLFDTATFLGRWRGGPAAGVGRNDPCPCGSGRKHKQCCLGRPTRVGLADRVELVWWKARTWCLRTQGLALPWSERLDEAEDGDADALVLDLALVADDALAAFTIELGPLLPEDEAALVESWLERPHRLWEVGEPGADGAVDLIDLTGPADGLAVTTVRAPDGALLAGEVVLAVVVPTGEDREQVVGQVVRVPPSARDDALALLADHPDGQQLLERVLDLGPDALVRPASRRG